MPAPNTPRWLEFERRWLSAYDAVWTVSEEDRRSAIAEGSRPGRTFTIANGVDIFRFAPAGAPASPPEILFVGSFRHFPNVLAFEALRDEVMPRVWKRFPNAVARVVGGPDHLAHWQRFTRSGRTLGEGPGLVVHGFVEDLLPLYERAAVVAAPMQVSAGTNIKMLEAMACGKAIVATPAACGGLGMSDGQEALVREDWPGLAEGICEVPGGRAPSHGTGPSGAPDRGAAIQLGSHPEAGVPELPGRDGTARRPPRVGRRLTLLQRGTPVGQADQLACRLGPLARKFKKDVPPSVAQAATPAGSRVVSTFGKPTRQSALQAWRLAPRRAFRPGGGPWPALRCATAPAPEWW